MWIKAENGDLLNLDAIESFHLWKCGGSAGIKAVKIGSNNGPEIKKFTDTAGRTAVQAVESLVASIEDKLRASKQFIDCDG